MPGSEIIAGAISISGRVFWDLIQIKRFENARAWQKYHDTPRRVFLGVRAGRNGCLSRRKGIWMKIISTLSVAGATVVSLAIAGAAFAADMAAPTYVKAPAPIFTWTGGYIGGQIGTGFGTSQTDVDVGNTFIGPPVNQTVSQLLAGNLGLTVPLPQVQMNGFIGGAQAGYNWQAGAIVYGIEGDFLGSGLKGHTDCFIVLSCTNKVGWLADITGRIGFTVDRAMVYVKGGAAFANATVGINQSVALQSNLGPGFTANGSINGSADKNMFGATLGGGLEYAFMPGWSAKLEYDYFDFGKQNLNVPVTAAGGIAAPIVAAGAIGIRVPVSVTEQIHTIKVGVNYHFN